MSVVEVLPAILRNPKAHQQLIFSLLKSCNSITKLTQIHAQIFINGFSHKNALIVGVISSYNKYGHLENARKVFDDMPEPSTTVWNQMICGYSHSGTPRKSVHLYARMIREGYFADEYTYSYLISSCSRSLMLREGEQIHGRILSNGYYSNSFIRTSLINLYLGLGDNVGLADAYKVFEDMPERNNLVTLNTLLAGHIRCGDFEGALRIFDTMPGRTIVSWTTMLTGCAKNGCYRQAVSLFQQMRRECLELDEVVLITALSVCAEVGHLGLGEWIHSYVNKVFQGGQKEVVNDRLFNALIHMYASCGDIEEALRIFDQMPNRTVVSWTTMIMGYAKQGFARKALDVFDWMQSSCEMRPDDVTFLGVLTACSHGGYVKEGRKYFKDMTEKWGVNPKIEHYGCMVDLMSRAGLLEEAQRVIGSMPMEPNGAVWGALLCGCLIHRDPEVGCFAAEKLMTMLDEEEIGDYLKPISKVYAMAKRWSEVAMVRHKIVETGLKNSTGKSWVQLDEAIHDFVADDTAHRHALCIYEMLDRLTSEVGYEANADDTIIDFSIA